MRNESHENNFIKFGRINQKMITREKLLHAGIELMKEGQEVTLELIAKKGGLSKATIYRYFSSKEVFIREASLHTKALTPTNLFFEADSTDLWYRVEKLINYHYELFMQNETEFRLFLSAVISDSVLNKKSYSRAGRRILLITEALKPIQSQTSPEAFEKMVNSISLILGIESVTVLKDLCQLKNKQVLDTWKWLIKQILAEFLPNRE